MNQASFLFECPPTTAHEFGCFLEARLGTPITVWKKEGNENWKCTQNEFQTTDVDLERAQMIRNDESDCEFVLPLTCFDGLQLSATGRISTQELELWSKFAVSSVREFQSQLQLEELKDENEQLAEQAIVSFEELSFLKYVTTELSQAELTDGIGPFVCTVLESLRSSIRAQAVSLVFDSKHRFHVCDASRTYSASHNDAGVLDASKLVKQFGHLAESTPFVKNNCGLPPEFEAIPGLNKIILVPVQHDGRLMGHLVAINQVAIEQGLSPGHCSGLTQREFGTIEAMVLNAAASIIATHVANVDLFKQQESLVTSMIRTLVSALDAKDSYTRGHSERVALYARLAAERMGLDDEQIEAIYLTGLLHDIGKIAIDDETLNHPGDLSDAQYEIIKKHPEEGWKILQRIQQLEHVLPGVLFHHERIDGAGYPDGLKGSGIPLFARILAVVDAYDAMTSNRPYRMGMSHEQATEILRRGSNVQWDSEIVDIFISAENEAAEIRNREHVSQKASRKKGTVKTLLGPAAL